MDGWWLWIAGALVVFVAASGVAAIRAADRRAFNRGLRERFLRDFADVPGVSDARSAEEAMRALRIALEAQSVAAARNAPDPAPQDRDASVAALRRAGAAVAGLSDEDGLREDDRRSIVDLLRDIAEAVAEDGPEARRARLESLALADHGARFDTLLGAALAFAATPRAADGAAAADALLFAEASLRHVFGDCGLAIDRPRLFCPPRSASTGFAAEFRIGGAFFTPRLPEARAAVVDLAAGASGDDAPVVDVGRFGLREGARLVRATRLIGYNPAEWR